MSLMTARASTSNWLIDPYGCLKSQLTRFCIQCSCVVAIRHSMAGWLLLNPAKVQPFVFINEIGIASKFVSSSNVFI